MYRLVLLSIVFLVSSSGAAIGADDGAAKAATCAACHGADGNSTTPEWPKLAGQHTGYIRAQVTAFKSGTRQNPLMSPIAANLSDEDLAVIAEFYASRKVRPGAAKSNLVNTGAEIYRGGNANAGVPACMACHGPRGSGNPAAGYPSLHGQHATYTAGQLNAYKNGTRSTDPGGVMRTIAARLSAHEIESVASYIEGLH